MSTATMQATGLDIVEDTTTCGKYADDLYGDARCNQPAVIVVTHRDPVDGSTWQVGSCADHAEYMAHGAVAMAAA